MWYSGVSGAVSTHGCLVGSQGSRSSPRPLIEGRHELGPAYRPPGSPRATTMITWRVKEHKRNMLSNKGQHQVAQHATYALVTTYRPCLLGTE